MLCGFFFDVLSKHLDGVRTSLGSNQLRVRFFAVFELILLWELHQIAYFLLMSNI